MSSTKNRFWLRRFRSSSFSSDLDVNPRRASTSGLDGLSQGMPSELGPSVGGPAAAPTVSDLKRARAVAARRSSRNRAVSTNYVDNYRPMSPVEFTATLEVGLEALRLDPHTFPFNSLTSDCKLMIFSWLNPSERGSAAGVCKEWATLMKAPSLWSDVDLIAYPPHPPSVGEEFNDEVNESAITAYEAYRKRAIRYISFLVTVRPALRMIRFGFDIADVRDGWLDVLQTLFRASHCNELEYAELNWNETPAKPYVPENSSATWSTNDYKDLMYKHRHRQRFFVKFFDFFTAAASSVTTLILPFDWTDRSLRALARLPNLDTLVLSKYFVFQTLEQSLIDTLFKSAPFLRRLTMEVWTPSGRGLQLFSMSSDMLEVLDVSSCRGFYLENVHLPNLKLFKVSICPMNGPLVSSDGMHIPCLLETLRSGAKGLEQINDYRLEENWLEQSCADLDVIMMSICACPQHTGL